MTPVTSLEGLSAKCSLLQGNCQWFDFCRGNDLVWIKNRKGHLVGTWNFRCGYKLRLRLLDRFMQRGCRTSADMSLHVKGSHSEMRGHALRFRRLNLKHLEFQDILKLLLIAYHCILGVLVLRTSRSRPIRPWAGLLCIVLCDVCASTEEMDLQSLQSYTLVCVCVCIKSLVRGWILVNGPCWNVHIRLGGVM